MPVNTHFAGVEDFAAALAGSKNLDQLAYDASTRRLIEGRSKRALMDKRVSDAAKSRMIEEAFTSMSGRQASGINTDILIGGRGSDFSSIANAEGQQIQNQGLEAAMSALQSSIETGEPLAIDQAFNPSLAISSNSPLTNTQVLPVEKTQGQIDKDAAAEELSGYKKNEIDAKVEALDALTRKRDRWKNTVAGKKSGGPRNFSQLEIAMNFPPDDEASNPYQEYQDFTVWKNMQSRLDDRYEDDAYAYAQWKNDKTSAAIPFGITPGDQVLMDASNALSGDGVVAGDQNAPVSVAPDPTTGAQTTAAPTGEAAPSPNYVDAQTLYDAANKAVADGYDYDAVMAILDAELKKLGLSRGQ